jgi:predicted Rossmann-fold nucleotide-binding protein
MDRFPDRPMGDTVFMYEQPPPYAGIYSDENHMNKFDERQKVQNGFVNPNDPSKIYVASAPSVIKNIIVSSFFLVIIYVSP